MSYGIHIVVDRTDELEWLVSVQVRNISLVMFKVTYHGHGNTLVIDSTVETRPDLRL
jgi:hypothetical protein